MNRGLPDPYSTPTIKVPQAAAVLGVSARALYSAVEAGTCPAIRVGRSVRIPTMRFLRHFGLAEEASIDGAE